MKLRNLIVLIGIFQINQTYGFNNPKKTIFESSPESDDSASNLISKTEYLNNLFQIESNNLKQSKLETSPWSDSYWPLIKGGIANNYAEQTIPKEFDFHIQKEWYKNFRPTYETASPAEKYDLVFGLLQSKESLSVSIWSNAIKRNEKNSIQDWEGICHGWAIASMYFKMPRYAVTIKDPTGHDIIFSPSDIKALASQMWANLNTRTNFAGKRSYNKKIDKDNYGREVKVEDRDTNPATWHTTIVNKIGLNKQSFVMDRRNDEQVWNQPIYSYSYEYFNPKKLSWEKTLNDAAVKTSDLRPEIRATGSEYIVGIEMTVKYLTETNPNSKMEITENDNAYEEMQLFYELEVDRHGNILGGEWRSEVHPDFLWSINNDLPPVTEFDSELTEDWSDKSKPVPDSWKNVATKLNTKELPLPKFVEYLIERSQTP